MAGPTEWVAGARPRTLPLAVAPVVAGTGLAAHDGEVRWGRAALALVVALALQIGVNYANDHSDGIRGTDADRVGPMRLVGSGAASPRAVLAAALGWFAVACAAGLVLAALTTWWLVAVGALAVAAAWTYTGGPSPYGYRALGEVSVLVFFGFVAVLGTGYVQSGRVSALGVLVSVTVGLLACAVLVANNLRDIPGDRAAGKRTLAVVLGDAGTRRLYVGVVAVAFAAILADVPPAGPWPLLGLLALPVAVAVGRPVVRGATGPGLVATLQGSGRLALVTATLLGVGLALAALTR